VKFTRWLLARYDPGSAACRTGGQGAE
jgi:hypothetical protein